MSLLLLVDILVDYSERAFSNVVEQVNYGLLVQIYCLTVFEWKCPRCSYTNNEDMSRAVFGDTFEARQTCIMCYNLRVPSSDGDSLAKN